jgi:dUTP pyrophosphatase
MSVSNVYNTYTNLKLRSQSASGDFGILKLCITDETLKNVYQDKVDSHNKQFETDMFVDSGFDLLVPNDVDFNEIGKSIFIDMGVKAELMHCPIGNRDIQSSPFYLYPRSSISKTPLMLANHTGIIDSGYRGNLIGAFRSLHLPEENKYVVKQHTRLLQLCHPSLLPIYVIIVDEPELSTTTRGNGGFGSTGI